MMKRVSILSLAGLVAGVTFALSPLPVARAPFERSATCARCPVEFNTRSFGIAAHLPRSTVQTNLYPWAEFRSGEKVVLVNGYDGRVKWNDQTGFGRIVFYQGLPCDEKPGREQVFTFALRVPSAKPPLSPWDEWPDDRMEVDETARRVTWHRPYTRPDGARADFTYTLSPCGEGKIAFDYDLGLPDDPSVVTNALGFEFRLQLPVSVVTNAVYGFNGQAHPLAPKEEMREFEKGRVYTKYSTDTFTSDTTFFLKLPGTGRDFSIHFPKGTLRRCMWEDGLRAWDDPKKAHRVMSLFWGIGGRAKSAAEANVKGRIVFDLGESPLPKLPARPKTGGIDFWGQDAVDIPRDPTGNLLQNGGFEQGLSGWAFGHGGASWSTVVAEGGAPFEEIVSEAKFGRKALRFRVHSQGRVLEGLQSLPLALAAGAPYVVSAWIKVPDGGATIGIDPTAASNGGDIQWLGTKAPQRWWGTTKGEWRRVQVPFRSTRGDCVIRLGGHGGALIDGVRVEPGTVATEAQQPPVEGNLVTADPDNNLRFGTPLQARLELVGDTGTVGEVEVKLRNFYNETVFSRKTAFRLPQDLDLDLDPARVGEGVFVLETVYTVGGRTWHGPYQRLSVTRPLDGTHPTAHFYVHFPWYEQSSRGETYARLARDWGITTTTWTQNRKFTNSAPTAVLARAYGIANRLHCLSSELAARDPANFGWGKPGLKVYTNATPEAVSFIETAAYEAGRVCDPDDRWWALWNEEEAASPYLRDALDAKGAGAEDRRRNAFETYFQFQHACWRGLKRAFDERGLKLMYAPTHGSCNFNPGGNNRPLIENFLATADRHGFKYDYIAVHTYHAIDGSVLGRFDRDANDAALIELLDRFGYPETTPIMHSEGFNILPFYIPAWNADGWADKYYGQPASQDLGNREFLQAAAMARIYVMDLARWPRVMTSHTWQHRPVIDARMAPYMWTKISNTLGRLLPDPRLVGRVSPRADVRGYCFRPSPDSTEGVLALWTTDNDVEHGLKPGPVLSLNLPEDVQFVDLMGNRREPPADGRVPLTAAPLFIRSRNAETLLATLTASR